MPEISEQDRELTPAGALNASKLFGRRDWRGIVEGESWRLTSNVLLDDLFVVTATSDSTVQICVSLTVGRIATVLDEPQTPDTFAKVRDFFDKLQLEE